MNQLLKQKRKRENKYHFHVPVNTLHYVKFTISPHCGIEYKLYTGRNNFDSSYTWFLMSIYYQSLQFKIWGGGGVKTDIAVSYVFSVTM